MKTLNNLKLRIMVRAFRIRLNNGEAFEAIAADYPALTADDLEAIHVQLTEKEARAMDDLKVRITLGDTTLEGTLDELLESGTFKMEYDQAGLNKIVQEAVALQRAEYQKDPQHYHVHTMTMDELPHHPCTAKPGAHTFGSEMYGIRHFNAWPICSGKHVTIWPNDDTGTSWRVYVGGTLNTAKEAQSNAQNHT